jgi:cysteine desulfurase / selenocysteine lyase
VAEHHANIVPWQMVCAATGATLKHVALNANQEIDIDDLATKVTNKTKMVALVHVSNVLASVLPAAAAAEIAHKAGARLLLDCCQSVPHMPVDVQARHSSLLSDMHACSARPACC